MNNSYSDNLAAANGPKGNLGDYSHASKLFVNNNLKFTPKTKFLYHCFFALDPSVGNVISALTQKYGVEIGLLVKAADLPKFTANVETKNQYNRKKNIQTGIQYQPITITFHDDNHGVTSALLEAYYRFYYADAWHGDQPGAYSKTNNGDNTYKNRERHQYRYGLDNNNTVPFFRSIQLTQLARSQYTTYSLVNPIITNWEHDSVESEGNSFMQNTITIQYEAVHYTRGSVQAGPDGSPTGFGLVHYDLQPSPLVPADTSTFRLSANDILPSARDTLQTFENNSTLTYPTASSNLNYTISNLYNNDAVGGLANIRIPKSQGNGGRQSATIATPSSLTTRTTLTSTSYTADLQNNRAKLDALAIQLFKNDFLLNGGSGVNGITTAWENLPISEQEAYRKLILEGSL
tara:strand:+ start:5076 stop:6290 length:1215 start_codon:yes stop_codon:yes gene_type:complete